MKRVTAPHLERHPLHMLSKEGPIQSIIIMCSGGFGLQEVGKTKLRRYIVTVLSYPAVLMLRTFASVLLCGWIWNLNCSGLESECVYMNGREIGQELNSNFSHEVLRNFTEKVIPRILQK